MNKKAKFISLIAVVGCVSMALTSCDKKDKNSPGVEFMPDMYRSPSLESNMAYTTLEKGDTLQVNRMPVPGTIARGYTLYNYPNTNAGYEAAGLNVHNPLEKTDANLKEGKELYEKFCVHCHGAGGEADGLVAAKLIAPPPAYSTKKDLSDGKMFHVITYGKGIMGAHASLLSQAERWKVVLYIRQLQFPNGVETTVKADSTATQKKVN
jgi:mono/diheme cytochrome c family protein